MSLFAIQQLANREPVRGATPWVLFVLLLCASPMTRGESGARNDKGAVGTAGAAMLVSPPRISGVIGDISITNGNVFDLSNPAEDRPLYRFANRLHITTRPDVIQQQLLLQTGDEFSQQAAEESERILRANRYIHDASVVPVQRQDGVVDLEVSTTDVWTFMPKLSFTRSGGKNNSTIGIKEGNLLGRGTAVELAYKSDPDRDSRIFRFRDNNLGDSWYGLETTYSSNSDGREYSIDFGKPFYSLNSRAANGVSLLDYDRIDSYYDRGDVISEYRHQGITRGIEFGWSRGLRDNWTKRYTVGFGSDEHEFSDAADSLYPPGLVPADRKLRYPTIGFEILEDKFEKASNVDQIDRVEDRYFGTRFGARLGYASEGLGSDRDAWIVNMHAHKGFGDSEKDSLMLDSELDARLEQGDVANFKLSVSAAYDRRWSEKSLLHVSLNGYLGHNLDLDNYVPLGGDSGIRGYPYRYQTGESAVLLTVEHRIFTKWYPFRLFRVGGAIFFDAGRTWGNSGPFVSDNELLRDVGIGLRLGGERSGIGRMIHVDVAFPLDGRSDIDSMQFYIATKKSF